MSRLILLFVTILAAPIVAFVIQGCGGTAQDPEYTGTTAAALGTGGSGTVPAGATGSVELPLGPHCATCPPLSPGDYGLCAFSQMINAKLVASTDAFYIGTDSNGKVTIQYSNSTSQTWGYQWTCASFENDLGYTQTQVDNTATFSDTCTKNNAAHCAQTPEDGCIWAGMQGPWSLIDPSTGVSAPESEVYNNSGGNESDLGVLPGQLNGSAPNVTTVAWCTGGIVKQPTVNGTNNCYLAQTYEDPSGSYWAYLAGVGPYYHAANALFTGTVLSATHNGVPTYYVQGAGNISSNYSLACYNSIPK